MVTKKEAVLMQQKVDTLKTINLATCINIESSKVVYPKKLVYIKFLHDFMAKYIMWRAKKDFTAVKKRIKEMDALIDYNTKHGFIEG